jgi:hypothetical protein
MYFAEHLMLQWQLITSAVLTFSVQVCVYYLLYIFFLTYGFKMLHTNTYAGVK